jgi:membrane associated rhomboid family serine protease
VKALRLPIATFALIAANVAVFVFLEAPGDTPLDAMHLMRLGGDAGVLTLSGDWWRAFTALFLHGSVLHLASNMFCLAFLGRTSERMLGHWRFLALYLLSGLVGSLLSAAAHPQVVGVGASGAVFGVAGSLLPLAHARSPGPAWENGPGSGRVFITALEFIAYNIAYSFAPGVDRWAHFGGLAGGLALGFALRAPLDAPPPLRRTAIAFLGAPVFLICGFWGARQLHRDILVTAGEVNERVDPGRIQAQEVRSLEQRVKHLEDELHTQPESVRTYVDLGNAYAMLERPDDARRTLSQGLHRFGPRFDLLTVMGSIDLNLSRLDDAVREFDQARQLEPGNSDARYNLATALMDRAAREAGDRVRDSALADYARVLDLTDDPQLRRTARQGIQDLGGR